MKIAVVGCGAVGSYYGAMLSRDGHDVHFLLRSDYETVRRHGVSIQSPAGDFNARPRCARRPADIGPSDVVLIALKTTANDQFPELLPPLVSPHTAVLTLQNGLGNEEQLARLFPVEQILGGLCFVCLNRVAPGVIQHHDHGTIMLGEFQRWPEPRTHDIASAFRHAGVVCKVSDNLARAHWEKLVWNVPFNGLGVASAAGYEQIQSPEARVRSPESGGQSSPPLAKCLTTRELLGDARWETLVRELMHEVIAVANQLGPAIPLELAEKQIERTRTMGDYKASTVIDFERALPLEVESLFAEPLRQARVAGVATPRLETLVALLQRLDPGAKSAQGASD